MKNLFIKKLNSKPQISLGEASYNLENQTVLHRIDQLNWEDFDYCPNVRFRIGHTESEIWLKYYVTEKFILAREIKTNGDVYKDSCVEFFISFDAINYYNFEFNAIGTTHVAFGEGRENRQFVLTEIIDKIKIQSSLGNQPFEEKEGDFNWEIMIRIPIKVFAFSKLNSWNKRPARANFYKCGDETSVPHYISWNKINTANPDYHRPEFFGKIQFE